MGLDRLDVRDRVGADARVPERHLHAGRSRPTTQRQRDGREPDPARSSSTGAVSPTAGHPDPGTAGRRGRPDAARARRRRGTSRTSRRPTSGCATATTISGATGRRTCTTSDDQDKAISLRVTGKLRATPTAPRTSNAIVVQAGAAPTLEPGADHLRQGGGTGDADRRPGHVAGPAAPALHLPVVRRRQAVAKETGQPTSSGPETPACPSRCGSRRRAGLRVGRGVLRPAHGGQAVVEDHRDRVGHEDHASATAP